MKITHRLRSNTEIFAMSILAFFCAAIMLLLFIMFSSSKESSFIDLSKFALFVMIIDFSLLIVYAVNGIIKEYDINSYGMRMWIYSIIVAILVTLLSIIAIAKVYDNVLPLLILSFAITTVIIILIVTTIFFFNNTTTVQRELSKSSSKVRIIFWRK